VKAILDSPAWRLVDALRSMYDPQTNCILIEGFHDAIRPPNDEEEAMLGELIRSSGSQLLAEQKKNALSWMNNWNDAEAMRHFLFDTTMNINGMWTGYTGPGAATIVPEKATTKIDFRLVPNQEAATQRRLVEAHLRKHGFEDLEYRPLGGDDEWSQTSVHEPLVQSLLAIYGRTTWSRWCGRAHPLRHQKRSTPESLAFPRCAAAWDMAATNTSMTSTS